MVFEPLQPLFQPIPPEYGDRVTAVNQGGFIYGAEEGFTPNVVVDYNFNAAPWATGSGDLVNVVYPHRGIFFGTYPYGIFELVLTADPGYQVSLHGFDMARWDSDEIINTVRVLDKDSNPLFVQDNAFIPVTGHRDFDFISPLVSQSLTIFFDSTNLDFLQSENVAMDNITFSQTSTTPIPEPTTLTLFGLGAFGLLGYAWRRQKR